MSTKKNKNKQSDFMTEQYKKLQIEYNAVKTSYAKNNSDVNIAKFPSFDEVKKSFDNERAKGRNFKEARIQAINDVTYNFRAKDYLTYKQALAVKHNFKELYKAIDSEFNMDLYDMMNNRELKEAAITLSTEDGVKKFLKDNQSGITDEEVNKQFNTLMKKLGITRFYEGWNFGSK